MLAASARASERLADARHVLDQHVPLGDERHDDELERAALRVHDGGERVDDRANGQCGIAVLIGQPRRLHQPKGSRLRRVSEQTLDAVEDARRDRPLSAFGSGSSPSRETSDDLVVGGCRSRCRHGRRRSARRGRGPCARACSRARSTPSAPVSAAKPTSTWPGRRARADRGEDVGRRLELERPGRRSRPRLPSRLGRAGSRRRPPPSARRRPRRPVRAPRARARPVVSTSIDPGRRPAHGALRERASITSAPRARGLVGEGGAHPAGASGCRGSARGRAARACRPAVTSTRRPASGPRGRSSAPIGGGDLGGLAPCGPSPTRPRRARPRSGPTMHGAARAQRSPRWPASPGAPTCARSSPGATTSGPRAASGALRQHVVGEAVRELRQRVRGARRDAHDRRARATRRGAGSCRRAPAASVSTGRAAERRERGRRRRSARRRGVIDDLDAEAVLHEQADSSAAR